MNSLEMLSVVNKPQNRCIHSWGGGDLKNSEQGGSVYFLVSEIWLKFTFLGEKIRIILLGRKSLKLLFWSHSR